MTRTARGVPDACSWEELVAAGLLGTDRRPVAGTPGELLDAAAAQTLRRRAGLLPAVAGARPEAAPPDGRPALPKAARRRLALLLADRSAPAHAGGRRGTAPDLGELLPQWLAAANERGYRAPAELLPALLDGARARTDLRPQALAFAGPRGLWLARLNPEWRFALRGAQGSGVLPDPGDAEHIQLLWDEGLFAERVALLGAVRRYDPGAGRALLAATWSTERAEDRLMFLDSLRGGLSDADEPFLERALSDRSRNVRATAAELLSALPGSALAARMARRAATCVSLDRTGEGVSIAVEAPHECDAAMQRDGVAPKPPAGRGERSWWLGQLVESAPLDTWAGAARRPRSARHRGAARGRRLGRRTARRVVPGSGAPAERGVVTGPARHPVGAARRGRGHDVPGRAGQAALHARGGGTGAVGGRVHIRARPVGGVPAARGVCRAVGGGIGAGGRRRAGDRAGRGQLSVELQRRHGPGGTLPRSVGVPPPGSADGYAAGVRGRVAGGRGYWAEAFQRLAATLSLRAAMREELRG